MAAVTGVIIPDLSLYLLAVRELTIERTLAKAISSQMSYSEDWQAICRINNLPVLWVL